MRKEVISFMLATIFSGLIAIGQAETRSSSQSDNSKEGWVKIGEKTVDLDENQGIFDWNNDREKTINAGEKYSAIRFRAKDAPVKMTNIEVKYDDGQKQNLSINSPVEVNSDSKVVSLNEDKKLDKITFNYQKDASARADKAKVEVWGLRAQTSGGMGSQGRTPVSEDKAWKKLGEKTVILEDNRSIFNWSTDRDKSVNANEKYSAIKFRAKDAPVNLTNVEIEYGNGQKKNFSINNPVPANGEGKVISIDSDQKLDKITFHYKKDESAKVDKTKLEVWGMKADAGAMGQSERSNNARDDQSSNRNK